MRTNPPRCSYPMRNAPSFVRVFWKTIRARMTLSPGKRSSVLRHLLAASNVELELHGNADGRVRCRLRVSLLVVVELLDLLIRDAELRLFCLVEPGAKSRLPGLDDAIGADVRRIE